MNSRQVDCKFGIEMKPAKHRRKRSAKKFKRSNSADRLKLDGEHMSVAGHFVLLFCANIFLSSDFEYCLRISMKNFSFIENSSLFEGNILRFRSLAAEQLYEHKSSVRISDQEIQVNLTNLFTALESAENALTIYTSRDKDETGLHNNIYGQALQEFQLGYLYKKYSKDLFDPNTHHYAKGAGESYPRKTVLQAMQTGWDKSIEYF